MMSLWDALRMNMMISYQELVRTFLNTPPNQHFKTDYSAMAIYYWLIYRINKFCANISHKICFYIVHIKNTKVK